MTKFIKYELCSIRSRSIRSIRYLQLLPNADAVGIDCGLWLTYCYHTVTTGLENKLISAANHKTLVWYHN